MTSDLAIDAREVVRVYGATTALAGADFSVRRGEIHGLLGENGAGKSTLVRILSGIEARDRGEVRILGTDLPRHTSPRDVMDAGAAFIHQDLGLVEDMSVAENIALGTTYVTTRRPISYAQVRRQAEDALRELGVENPDVDVLVGRLPLASRTLVAIARALAGRARVLVLDEPTAAMQGGEVDTLFRHLRALADAGVACVLISHRMDEIMRLCDRVTVFRNGADVGTREMGRTDRAELVSLIIGTPEAGAVPPVAAQPGTTATEVTELRSAEPVLTLRGLSGDGVGPIDLDVRPGEVTVITGLADSGHLAVPSLVLGLEPIAAGRMTLSGRPFAPRGISDCRAAGIGYVPPDRLTDGVATGLTIMENLYLNPARPWWKPASIARARRQCAEDLKRFRVHPPEPMRPIATLSGGNQQKVLLGRALVDDPRVFICCEPTAGIDVGAKRQIHGLLRSVCRSTGMAVVLVTSDFEEAADVGDRAYVLNRGRLVAQLSKHELSTAAVTAKSFG